MIKTPLSTVIGGAFWTPGCTVIGGSTPTFDQQIQKLFANGEQGFFYDPNDLTTMYQDAAGTVPVTGVGQPVGLIRDKSGRNNHAYQTVSASRPILQQTPTLGSELVTDNTIVASPAQSTIRYFNFANRMPNLQAGKTYKIEYTLRNYAGGGVVGLSGNNPAGFSSFSQTANGTYSTVRAITANGALLFAVAANTGVDVVDISVKEVTGYRTDQNYLAFDGSDDFLQTNNIDFTATDEVSLFAGVRKLSDAATGTVCELSANADSSKKSFVLFAPAANGANHYNFRSFGTLPIVAQGTATTQAFPAPNSAVLTAKGIISSAICTLNINSTVKVEGVISQGTGNYGNYPLYIGRRGGTTLPFNGHIYSLIGIGRLTTDVETIALEKELAKRLGVNLNV